MTGADYAEAAAYTSAVWCVVCGPVLREHLPNGQHVTYHRLKAEAHPGTTLDMPEDDLPVQ